MSTVYERIYQLVATGHLSHAYAMTGSYYEGKRQATTALIKALICSHKQGFRPCQQCEWCQRAEDDQLSDVIRMEPDGRMIKIDQVRELKEWLSTRPMELKCKIAIIEHADWMNVNAANAMLKFLEEPAENVYLILYTTEMSDLLPTIQSRVQELYIPEATISNQIEGFVKMGVSSTHAAILAQLPSRVKDYWIQNYQEQELSDWFDQLNHFYRLIYTGNPTSFLYIQTQLKSWLNQSLAALGIDYLIWLNHQLLLEESPHYFIEQLRSDPGIKMEEIVLFNELLVQSMELLEANVSAQLAYEYIALNMDSKSHTR